MQTIFKFVKNTFCETFGCLIHEEYIFKSTIERFLRIFTVVYVFFFHKNFIFGDKKRKQR